jgi:signal transduction histidine kinase
MLTNKPTPQVKNISIFDAPVDVTKRSLAYDENNLTIGYLGVWYKNPEGIFFSYQLENYDRTWITTRNQSVTYSQLPAGDYRFKLRASESDDFRNVKETSISFTVLPPIWRTFPFYLTVAGILTVSIFFVVKQREKKLRRYNELLEQKVEMRTKEIQVQNEEIQAQNEEISAQSEEIMRINENLEEIVQERTRELEKKNKALEEYAFINAHKLRSPVASILGLLNLISKTRLDPEAQEINVRLQQTADELDTIVGSITKAIERADRKIPKLKDE